mgnify:CR=1 FL=1
MFKQIVTFGVACAVLTGAAAEAAGVPMFDNRTRQVAGSAVTSDYSGDTLYTESDENLLVARVDSGRPERKTVRKPVGKTIKQTSGISAVKPVGTRMSLDELRRHRPQGKPAARIVTEEARPAVLPVRQAEKPAPVVADMDVSAGDDSVFDIEPDSSSVQEPAVQEPISFKGKLNDASSSSLGIQKASENASYKEDISGFSSFASDGAFVKDSVAGNRISSIPAIREESDYQLLDYTNGVFNKIYTKVGYATVVILPPGEKLNRVTLGDRQRFSVQSVFDKSSGCWHIYLKPAQMDIETNMVISTNRHLFNATLATSSFFKPFAKWINVPGAMESVSVEDGALDLAVKDVNQLNFKYARQGKADFSWGPLNVFDDKNGHTFMNFDAAALTKNRPLVFTRGIDGEMKMVPFSVYRNTYVIDNIYDNLEVRSGSKSVRFVKKS